MEASNSEELKKRIISSLILIPITFFLIIKGSLYFVFFLIICFLITIYEWHTMSRNKNYYLVGLFFLFFSFYCTYNLRVNFDEESLFIFLFVILICISNDIGGYTFGKLFGGPKLTKISPKKTFSGVFGSYFLSLITIFCYFKFANFIGYQGYELTNIVLIFVIMISTVSQIGDLTMSLFKRLSKIKDTGKIIPGHGGLLDRIDGMLFALPFSYIIFSNKNII